MRMGESNFHLFVGDCHTRSEPFYSLVGSCDLAPMALRGAYRRGLRSLVGEIALRIIKAPCAKGDPKTLPDYPTGIMSVVFGRRGLLEKQSGQPHW